MKAIKRAGSLSMRAMSPSSASGHSARRRVAQSPRSDDVAGTTCIASAIYPELAGIATGRTAFAAMASWHGCVPGLQLAKTIPLVLVAEGQGVHPSSPTLTCLCLRREGLQIAQLE